MKRISYQKFYTENVLITQFLILCYAKSPSRLLIEDLSWRTVSSNSMTACKIAFSQATHVDVKCCPAQ